MPESARKYREHDSTISPEAVEHMRGKIETRSEVSPKIDFYSAGHAFFNDMNPASYYENSATRAWGRAMDFPRRRLG